MDVTRLLRVLITLLLVMTFILVIVSVYRHDMELREMVNLSDLTSSTVTRLAVQDLAWDAGGGPSVYVLDSDKLDDLSYQSTLWGFNLEFQVEISYQEGGVEQVLSPHGFSPPDDRMTCALNVPVALQRSGRAVPAILKVIAWYA